MHIFFSSNGLIKEGDVLNKDTLVKIQMPNRDGFIDLYPAKVLKCFRFRKRCENRQC